MALDGDVDFKPDSIRLLLDRMKKNKKVAAVCGRIHPIGDGPMVWYQQFEYAVGHWLQKAAEHVFGCVLCCPGCFSLFRLVGLLLLILWLFLPLQVSWSPAVNPLAVSPSSG